MKKEKEDKSSRKKKKKIKPKASMNIIKTIFKAIKISCERQVTMTSESAAQS